LSLIILCKNLLPSSCSSCIAPFRGCQNPINGLLTVCAAKNRDQLRDPTLSNRVRHKVVTDCGLYTLSYRFYRPTRSGRMKKLTPAKYRIYNSVGLHCTPLKYGTNSCICISLYDAGLPFCFSSTSLQSHVYSIRRWTKAISSQNYGLFVGRTGTAPVGCCFPPHRKLYRPQKSLDTKVQAASELFYRLHRGEFTVRPRRWKKSAHLPPEVYWRGNKATSICFV